MDYSRRRYGRQFVLANNSIRESFVTIGGEYREIYAHMKALGGLIELPSGFAGAESSVSRTPAQLTALDARLEANAHDAP